MKEKTKERLKKAGYFVSGLAIGIAMTMYYRTWCEDNIPYTYRSTTLDVIDYVAGRNVFGRKDSLMMYKRK